MSINKTNVGRVAERIVANELEARGFRVTDLNKEGIAANADLLATKGGKTWQVQVKGSSGDKGAWFNYGACNDSMIQDRTRPVFNRAGGFYKAEMVVLVWVSSLTEYCCIVLPMAEAERAAQLNLDLFRMPKGDGGAKKASRMWCDLNHIPKTKSDRRREILIQEQQIIQSHKDAWHIFQ